MQSHDAEFRERGEVVPTISDWAARKNGTYTDNELDAKWSDLIAEGNDAVTCMHAEYERALREANDRLAELRDYARMKLSEGK